MINIARGTALASSEGMNDNNTAVAVGRSNESSNISTSSSNGTRIVVEGCGLSEVNGTYNRRLNTYNGAPVYVKHGTNLRGHGIYRDKDSVGILVIGMLLPASPSIFERRFT